MSFKWGDPMEEAYAERIMALEDQISSVYRERAHLVALLAALSKGAVLVMPEEDSIDWWPILYMTIGGKQASWHIAPDDLPLFDGIPRYPAGHVTWDGHTTEEKYQNIHRVTRMLLGLSDD
ncbi:hypothetical protein [Streptomyces sp. URMC 129]|uniref:hypothetical protein n=1 Tax=Streptomyces sp. URMC 129 TaxID=3423407 RepID=UPI003F19A919